MDKQTEEFYEKQASNFAQKTISVDISFLTKKFISVLAKGAKILDVGCGSGRDLKFFKKQRFQATGIEKSSSLAQFAQNYSGCQVTHGSVEALPFPNQTFEGIWCCAVLVHFDEEQLLKNISEMIRVAKHRACFMFSVKKGLGCHRDTNGRLFYLYEKDQFLRLLANFPFNTPIVFENTDTTGTEWINTFTFLDMPNTIEAPLSISAAISRGNWQLQQAGIENSRMEAEWLLEHVTQQEHSSFYSSPHKLISKKQQDSYFQCLEKRSQRCPFAYITGTKSFLEFEFKVTPAVLIPRPETELLVEYIIQNYPTRQVVGLDIGTGSGCIAIALLKKLPNAQITAIDISAAALQVAFDNAKRWQVTNRLTLVEGDLFDPLYPKNSFDFIVSNPPYISEQEYVHLMPEVRIYEPKQALIAKRNGLQCYHSILTNAHQYIKPGGELVLELGYGQLENICHNIPSCWEKKKVIRDFADIERVLVLRHIGEGTT